MKQAGGYLGYFTVLPFQTTPPSDLGIFSTMADDDSTNKETKTATENVAKKGDQGNPEETTMIMDPMLNISIQFSHNVTIFYVIFLKIKIKKVNFSIVSMI